MTILENELVQKFFAPECKCIASDNQGEDCMNRFAANVLTAMQQPILKGERYLVTRNSGVTWEESSLTGWPIDKHYHPLLLRLPDLFQKKKCEVRYSGHKCYCDNPMPHHILTLACSLTNPSLEPEKCPACRMESYSTYHCTCKPSSATVSVCRKYPACEHSPTCAQNGLTP